MMSYTAADAMRDMGYSEDEVETALDMGVAHEYLYPKTPEENVHCEHGNHIWFGHECGECE